MYDGQAKKRIRKSVLYTEGDALSRRRTRRGTHLPDTSWFVARITGHALLTENRWKYAWREQRLNGDQWEDLPGGLAGTTTDKYALNVIEALNVAPRTTQGNSVNQGGGGYPVAFALRPVGGTAGVAVNVLMRREYDKTGKARFVFAYENADDGDCGIPSRQPPKPPGPRIEPQPPSAGDV